MIRASSFIPATSLSTADSVALQAILDLVSGQRSLLEDLEQHIACLHS